MTPQELFDLGICHFEGKDGIAQDYQKAHALFLEAAQAGHTEAQAYLGRMYAMGEGVEQNYEEAVKWIIPAAEGGNPDAMNRLGVRYYLGQGIDKNKELAFIWYTKSAEAGCVKAMINLGRITYKEDRQSAYKWLTKAAETGNSEAMRVLGKLYHLDKNRSAAIEWFTKAAEAGDTESMIILGDLYIRTDPKQSYKLYRKAAIKGSKKARRKFSDLYNGTGSIDIDIQEHIRLLYIWKDVHSLLSLAYFTMNGIGMKADAYEAVRLWKRIHQQGYKIANYNLAVAHYYGIGVDQDSAKAKEYLADIIDCDEYASQMIDQIDHNSVEKPIFHLYSPAIIPDSILEAETLTFSDRYSKAINIYNNNPSAESYFRLARYYKHEKEDRDLLDTFKSEQFFKKSVSLGHPYAIYLNALYKDSGKTYEEYDLYSPYFLSDLVDECYPDDDIYNIWDIIYVLWSILRQEKDSESLKQDPADYIQIVLDNMHKGEAADQRRAKLFSKCMIKDRNIFIRECDEFIWGCIENGKESSLKYPSKSFIEEVNAQIGQSELICFYEGTSLKFLKFLIPEKKYIFQSSTQKQYAMAHFVINMMGATNVTIKQKDSELEKCDLLVIIPKLDELKRLSGTLKQRFQSQALAIRLLYGKVKNISAKRTDDKVKYSEMIQEKRNDGVEIIKCKAETKKLERKFKRAIVLVNKSFTSSLGTEISGYRIKLVKDQYVEAITEFPKETFSDIETSTSLLCLNFEERQDNIRFKRNGNELTVDYDTIGKNKRILCYDLYARECPKSEDMIIVKFYDLLTFRAAWDKKRKDEKVRVLSGSDFQSTLLNAISRTNKFTYLKSDRPSPILKEYHGQHIFLKYQDGVRLNIQTDKAFCYPGYGTYVIKLKDKAPVTFEYLVYLLMSEEVSKYMASIIDKNNEFMIREFLYMDIAIHKSKNKQKEIVEQALRKERQRIEGGLEYNVVVLSDDQDIQDLIGNEAGFSLFAKDSTYDEISERYIHDSKNGLIDAILIDGTSDEFEDIMEDFNEIRDKGINLYIIHDDDEILITGKKKRTYFLDGNRCFNIIKEEDKKRLIIQLRDDLDSSNVAQAKIRNKYKDVFEAADKLSAKYTHIKISEAILEYIQRGCTIDNLEDVSGPCAQFRNVCHKLLELLAEKNLVPKLEHPGGIPSFIHEGRYHDSTKGTSKSYVLIHPFMSQYLGKALDYFCKVTNEGVHGSQDSSRLGTAALHILMEFIVWFYENDIRDNKFSDIPPKFSWDDVTESLMELKDKVVEVKVYNDGKDSYIYADNIHFKDKADIKEGMKVRIKRISIKTINDNQRLTINGKKILFFVSDYDIIKPSRNAKYD